MLKYYSYKDHQFNSFAYQGGDVLAAIPVKNEYQIFIDTRKPVDKIRITLSATTLITPGLGLLVWSDLFGNYIGTCGNSFIGNAAGGKLFANDLLEPLQGVEFVFPNKTMLQGNYTLKFTYTDGSIPIAGEIEAGRINILIEYFVV